MVDAHRPALQGAGRRQPARRLQVHRRRALAARSDRAATRTCAARRPTSSSRMRGEPRHPGDAADPRQGRRRRPPCCWPSWPSTRSGRAGRCSTTSTTWPGSSATSATRCVNIVMTGIEGKQHMARMLDALRADAAEGDRRAGGDGVRGPARRERPAWARSRGRPTPPPRNFLIFRLRRAGARCAAAQRHRAEGEGVPGGAFGPVEGGRDRRGAGTPPAGAWTPSAQRIATDFLGQALATVGLTPAAGADKLSR